jgi:hypothetical protein
MKMEIIRLASIPIEDKLRKTRETPLLCVNRVQNVEITSAELDGQYLNVRVGLDLEGLGYWEQEINVFIYSEVQLAEARNREIPERLRGIVD